MTTISGGYFPGLLMGTEIVETNPKPVPAETPEGRATRSQPGRAYDFMLGAGTDPLGGPNLFGLAGASIYSPGGGFAAGYPALGIGPGMLFPGTWSNYDLMLRHPVVALATAAADGPVKAAEWSYEHRPLKKVKAGAPTDEAAEQVAEGAEDAEGLAESTPEDRELAYRVEFIRAQAEAIRVPLLEHAVSARDYGKAVFEIVFKVKPFVFADGERRDLLQVHELVPLLPELTNPIVDARTGALLGAMNQDSRIDLRKIIWIRHRGRPGNWHGVSRLENIKIPYFLYNFLYDKMRTDMNLCTGVFMELMYPYDAQNEENNWVKDAQGNRVHVSTIALRNRQSMTTGTAIIKPFPYASIVEEMARNKISVEDLDAWRVKCHQTYSAHGADFETFMKLLRVDICMGLYVTPRSVLESEHGSKADAESHTDITLNTSQEFLNHVVQALHDRGDRPGMIGTLLEQNWGPDCRDDVRVKSAPLIDERLAFLEKLVTEVLTNPQNLDLLLEAIDLDGPIERVGLTMRQGVDIRAIAAKLQQRKDEQAAALASKAKDPNDPDDRPPGGKPGQQPPSPPEDGGHGLEMGLSEDAAGHWVTIDGAHVFIQNGTITKGPAHLQGKNVEDLGKSGKPITAVHGVNHPETGTPQSPEEAAADKSFNAQKAAAQRKAGKGKAKQAEGGEWTRERIEANLLAEHEAQAGVGSQLEHLRSQFNEGMTGLHPDELEQYKGDKAAHDALKQWVNEDGWSNRALTQGEIDTIIGTTNAAKRLENAKEWARGSGNPSAELAVWMHDNPARTKKEFIDISTPDKVEEMLGKTFTINGEPFKVMIDEHDVVHLVDTTVEFPHADSIGKIPVDKGSTRDLLHEEGFVPGSAPETHAAESKPKAETVPAAEAKPKADAATSAKPAREKPAAKPAEAKRPASRPESKPEAAPKPEEDPAKPLTGRQRGLLGDRYDGGATGSVTRGMFGDVRPGAASAIEQAPADADEALRQKFANTPTMEMFPAGGQPEAAKPGAESSKWSLRESLGHFVGKLWPSNSLRGIINWKGARDASPQTRQNANSGPLDPLAARAQASGIHHPESDRLFTEAVKQVAPSSTVENNHSGWTITHPNGRIDVVRIVDEIPHSTVSDSAFAESVVAHYGNQLARFKDGATMVVPATSEEFLNLPAAVQQQFREEIYFPAAAGADGIISMVADAKPAEVLAEELFHASFHHDLTQAQRDLLIAKYHDDEQAFQEARKLPPEPQADEGEAEHLLRSWLKGEAFGWQGESDKAWKKYHLATGDTDESRRKRERRLVALLLLFWTEQEPVVVKKILAGARPAVANTAEAIAANAALLDTPGLARTLYAGLIGPAMAAAHEQAITLQYTGDLDRVSRELMQQCQKVAEQLNTTTAKHLHEALGGLPTEGEAGLDTAAVITDAVKAVYDEARDERADVIAEDQEWAAEEMGGIIVAELTQNILQWHAEDDPSTCSLCRELDGRTALAGTEFMPGIRYPVWDSHPSCRCYLSVYIEGGTNANN